MAEFVTTKFDDGGFRYFLMNVKGSKLKTALKNGLRKSLNIIRKEAVSNLKALKFKSGSLDIDKTILFINNKRMKYTLPPFKKGVMTKVFKDGSGGRVEVMGKGKNYNPILTMIEAGKGERKTRAIKIINHHKMKVANHSTGSITRTFFTSAVQSTKSEVQKSLQKNLDEAINKAREKFYKQ